MPKVTVVELSEAELEEMLVSEPTYSEPTYIEEGMQVLARQFPTDSGPLDVLASDTDKVLCIIELKNRADERHLDQGLRYYDWARMNLEGIARHFSGKVDASQVPKLILVAPSFFSEMVRIAKYLSIPMDLKEYTCLQVGGGERVIVCRSVEVGEPPGPPSIPTDEVNLGNIENERVRTLCRKALDELRAAGIEMRPKLNYWFSCWYRGKRFFYLGCKRQFFVLEVEKPDRSWSRIRVTNESEYQKALDGEIIPSYRALGGTGLTKP